MLRPMAFGAALGAAATLSLLAWRRRRRRPRVFVSGCYDLLHSGQLPQMNVAGSKGRETVPEPVWRPEIKQQTIALIRPDSECFLRATGRPQNTWEWA